ncbi:MAG: LLM class flavin-dependent oxidoreductase [Acidimicrobiales bacterium]
MSRSGSSLRVGVSTPWNLARLPGQDQQRCLAAIADGGLDFVFTADHVSFHDGSGIDGPVHLAAMGGMEPRLDLYLGVFLLALRHPMVAARQIASLAEMAPGRLTVGVGVGGEDRHEFEVCGVDPATRGRRTDAALAQVRALLSGETVDGDGDQFDFIGGRIRPVPDPPVPFVVGGRSDAALRRAGRLGDGWLATWCSVDRFRQGVELVERVGADREVAWRHGIQTWVGVGADPDEGRHHVAKRMTAFYKIDFSAFARYTPVGNPEQIAAFLRPYVEAGATSVGLTPCGANGDAETEGMARVAELLR